VNPAESRRSLAAIGKRQGIDEFVNKKLIHTKHADA
jgi:hypothetical protein